MEGRCCCCGSRVRNASRREMAARKCDQACNSRRAGSERSSRAVIKARNIDWGEGDSESRAA